MLYQLSCWTITMQQTLFMVLSCHYPTEASQSFNSHFSKSRLKLPAAKPPAKPANGRARIWDSICLAHNSDSFHCITLPPLGSINPYTTLKGRYYHHFREAGSDAWSAYQTSLQLVNHGLGKATALKPDSSPHLLATLGKSCFISLSLTSLT